MDTLSLTMDCGLCYAEAQAILCEYEDGEDASLVFDIENNYDYAD